MNIDDIRHIEEDPYEDIPEEPSIELLETLFRAEPISPSGEGPLRLRETPRRRPLSKWEKEEMLVWESEQEMRR